MKIDINLKVGKHIESTSNPKVHPRLNLKGLIPMQYTSDLSLQPKTA
jgi:hypothetical protein